MKMLKSLFTLTVIMLVFSATTFAQASATATATATILEPISIQKDVDMNFGNLAVNNTAGTVVLTPEGTRTATGGVSFLTGGNEGTITAATFTVSGLTDATYSITLPPGTNVISDGSNTMWIDSWTSTPTPSGTLTDGSQTVTVGATLHVSADQTAGEYSSSSPFEVTVNYN